MLIPIANITLSKITIEGNITAHSSGLVGIVYRNITDPIACAVNVEPRLLRIKCSGRNFTASGINQNRE